MPGFRRFVCRTLAGGVPVLILTGLIIYFAIAVRPQMTGDLGVLGKIPFGQEYHQRIYAPAFPDTLVRWYPFSPGLQRVATAGDSFSMQVDNGYQNYLAHKLGEPVTYIVSDRARIHPEQSIVNLLNSGFFDGDCPIEWIVLETVERELVDRWSRLSFDSPQKESYLLCVAPGKTKEEGTASQQSYVGSIFRDGLDWFKLVSGLDDNPVKHTGLSADCFTVPGRESELYFYEDDLNRLSVSPEELRAVAANIRRVHDIFASKGIKMLFLIAPDKYEVYQHYAAGNPYPGKALGQEFHALDSLGFVVNPLDNILKMVESGEKDVFMGHDSHWSGKGAEVAASMIASRIAAGE